MFKKILIANRGEIACRIMRTAKRLGIQTVAVYSEADDNALHVRMADEAIPIGPASSAESYLRADKLIEAARITDAEAIHPGFGFLSENAQFASALKEAGIKFIGPGVRAIKTMGDKIESKKLAVAAGVNTVPGHAETLTDAQEALDIAKSIGFPVMLKASAGGGGKGMRVAWREDEIPEAFELARSEAKASFGDDRVFIEKFIEKPRHIEIQIMADSYGNTIYLGERECSIQRRHQKVIEEAPSPFVDDTLRKAMGEQAVALARAVEYCSAGTVEFIVDRERRFYFLEMNTRLQVEHPVTEWVTGLDLVELMLRVAWGEPLTLVQEDVQLNGWAIESRIYAEDPERGFLPATGRLARHRPPLESGEVRLDVGVEEGTEISIYYDPMIAKLITHGKTREGAINAMSTALDTYSIRGIGNNLNFLSSIVRHPAFREGRISTDFIETYYGESFIPDATDKPLRRQLIAAAVFAQREIDGIDMWKGKSPSPPSPAEYVAWVGSPESTEIPVRLYPHPDGFELEIEGVREVFKPAWRVGDQVLSLKTMQGDIPIQVEREGRRGWKMSCGGARLVARVFSPKVAKLQRLMPIKWPPDLSQFLASPMPGLLVRVSVVPGEEIKAGQELAVVEAMKMENILHALQDGVIAAVHANAGDSLAVEQPILEFAQHDQSPELPDP